MTKYYSKKDYPKLMEELKKYGQEKPKKAQREAFFSLIRMGKIRVEGKIKFLFSLPLVISIFAVIVNIVTCYFFPEFIIINLFGLVFFLVGYNISFKLEEDVKIVFMFSHGLIGFIVMNASSFAKIIKNPLLSDSPVYIILLLILAALLLFASLIYGTIYSFITELKSNPIRRCIPILLASLSTTIIQGLAIYLSL